MTYSKYKLAILFRIAMLFFALVVLVFSLNNVDFKANLSLAIITVLPTVVLLIILLHNLYKFMIRRFIEMDDFFDAVKYRDFSRWFSEKSGSEDIRRLHRGFNEVNSTIKNINTEKEAQHLYLQKILELVDTGIVAYNIETGVILWINDAFKDVLDIPSLKNIAFIEKRKPQLYTSIFTTNYASEHTISIDVASNKTKILISNSNFKINDDAFKLIVLKNIDNTLDQTESEAWKKLLSVMTHEIMNSIAPISSLAETLQLKVQLSIKDPQQHPIDVNDLEAGIGSIKKRSEGLLKFAKTYRNLNKITKLNLGVILVSDLFDTIEVLMRPSLESKHIALDFEIENPGLKIEIDTYLIEQVLINLILNAVDGCKDCENPSITISAQKDIDGHSIIRIKDNGNGIPDEIIDDVFIPFFSTKKNGSGIGLSLCQQIMFLHKGKIQINSIENTGTVIRLVF